MDEEQYNQLLGRIDILIKLVCRLALPGEMTLNAKATTLSSLGLRPKDIGWLLDKDPQRIREILSKQRKNSGKSKKQTGTVTKREEES
jgi:tRNA nucleotidyltransferase/poly(A) polymerase